jgi:hypothetical protein
MKLTGAAILVSRGIKVLQAAPAGELHRSTEYSQNDVLGGATERRAS